MVGDVERAMRLDGHLPDLDPPVFATNADAVLRDAGQ
jgi:hypothetical protein